MALTLPFTLEFKLMHHLSRILGLLGILVAQGCGRIGFDELSVGGSSDRGGSGGMGTSAQDGAAVGTSGASGSGGAPAAGSSAGAPDVGIAVGGAAGSRGTSSSGGADGGKSGGGAGGALATGGTGGAATGGAAGSGGATGCVPTNGGVEICDGVDNDCNLVVDDGSVCASGCTGGTYGGHTYAFCRTARGWNEAEADCIAQGMRLARIDDAFENQFVYDTAFRGYSGRNVPTIWPWLGATDVGTPGQWRWPDGTLFWTGQQNGSLVGGLYAHWLTSAPSDSAGTACALLQFASSNWKDAQCVSLQPYVCEGY